MNNVIVPDANVFVKLLYPEPEHELAKQFFHHCNQDNISLIVPDLFRHEVLAVVSRHGDDISNMLNLLEQYEKYSLHVITPYSGLWKQAQKIVQLGNKKSGFPSLYDAIYHALAVEYEGIFVTADRRHYEKVKQFGYIALLSDYVMSSSIPFEIKVPNATTQKVLAEIDNGEILTEFSNTDELTEWLRED